MTTVVVYGAAGFIGRHVTRVLEQETGWVVLGYDRRPAPGVLDADPDKPWPPGVRHVVNLAADADAAWTMRHPRETVDNGVNSTVDLLERARAAGVERFVQVSTAEVYGTAACDHTTGCRLNPQTPYAAAKAAQDMCVTAWHATYGVPTVIARTANVFGPGQPDTRFLPTITRRVLAGEPVQVVPGCRRFIHVEDVAYGILRALQADTVDPIVHLTGETISDHTQFAGLAIDALGRSGGVPLTRIDPTRPGHFGDLTAIPTVVPGWRQKPLADRVEQTVRELTAVAR